ncbi:protein kinase [Frankia sp. Cpl3]|nr:serine/threonine-protein kinase [Parafrankia colletiae]MCK9905095.1 protein kinase [Frankia sp. Cpl3]
MSLRDDDPRRISGYSLRARIGEGGMGAVYLSYTPGGRPVAVKVARAEFATDPDFRRRFATEVRIAQQVQGLYTAPVIDSDPHGDRPWLATAYVPGPSLAGAVSRLGPLPEETVLVLIAGIAEALQVIHRAGIIHRDLKPGNVILAVDGPRVIDFGISRAAMASSAARTQTGAQIGTPAFMAPEQVRGAGLGPSADVFALGATAYYAVTGELPFGADAAVFHRVLNEEPDWERCPPRLRTVLAPCVLKDPAGRPAPERLIELCRAVSADDRLRAGEGWLPPTVAADLTRYALAAPPDPEPVISPPPLQPTGFAGVAPPSDTADGPRPWAPPPDGPRPPASGWPAKPVWLAASVIAAVVVLVVVLVSISGDDGGDELSGLPPASQVPLPRSPGSELPPSGTDGEQGGTEQPSTTATDAPVADEVVYLADLEAVETDGFVESSGGDSAADAEVSGVAYPRSVLLWTGDEDSRWPGRARAEFNLGRSRQRLQATIGLSDKSISSARYRVEIHGDGRLLMSEQLSVGSAVPADIDVKGILRLRISIFHLGGDTEERYPGYLDSSVVLGDARVSASQTGG